MADHPASRPTPVPPVPSDPEPDRRTVDLGPPPGTRERRARHTTKSGLTATDGLKMACPFCGASESAVVRVRGLVVTDAIRRRRECARCGQRFPTSEAVDHDLLARERGPAGEDGPDG